MDTLVAFGFLGLIANRAVDFLRNAFDKQDRVPKAYWLFIAWALGIGEAFLVVNQPALQHFFHIAPDTGVDSILVGMGFGSIAGFWHELLSALSARSGVADTPKGLVPNPK